MDRVENVEGAELVRQIERGCAALLVRQSAIRSAWLTRTQVERAARSAHVPVLTMRAISLGSEAWILAIEAPGGREDPFNPMYLQAIAEEMTRRLAEAWQEAYPESSESCQAQDSAPVAVTPMAPLCLDRGKETNIAELNALLEVLVKNELHAQFQPIADLRDGRTLGHEALIRGLKGALLRRSGHMFRAANKARLVSWFDLACLDRCFALASSQQVRRLLFFNLDAEGLAALQESERALLTRAGEHGLGPSQLVVEVTERQAVEDFPRLWEHIAALREQGFQIAVDDAGAGYSSLNAIAELRPEFVKIDRDLVRGIDAHGGRRALVAAFVRYAADVGAAVIGEGAESRDELSALIDLGASYAQGYVLGRPVDSLRGVRREIREAIRFRHQQQCRASSGREIAIGALARRGSAATPETPIGIIARLFAREPALTSVVVTEGDKPVGLIARDSLGRITEMAESACASDILPGETASSWMVTEMVVAREDESAASVGRAVGARPRTSLDLDVVVVDRSGAFCGVAPVRALLEALTRQVGALQRLVQQQRRPEPAREQLAA